jgi:hypothetical protein
MPAGQLQHRNLGLCPDKSTASWCLWSALVPALLLFSISLLFSTSLNAAELKGKVQFGGLPLPGATITATANGKTLTAVAGDEGQYIFADITPGDWAFDVEMLCFEPLKQQVTVGAGEAGSKATAGPEFDMKMLPLDQIKSFAATPPPEPPRISITQNTEPAASDKNAKNSKNTKNQRAANAPAASAQASFQRTTVSANPNAEPAQSAPDTSASSAIGGANQAERAADGLLVNGSQNNGASTPFAQAARFGNNVRGPGSLYNGGLAFTVDHSSLDARTYSFTGQGTEKPAYTKLTGNFNIGGPIRIPHILRNGPQFFVNYVWTRNRSATTTAGLMPTDAERAGDFSAFAPVYNPQTGAPFPGNQIPASQISPQAQALLKFYPEPNFTGSTRYNYQIPILTPQHVDGLQSRVNKNIGNKNQVYGNFAFQRVANDNQSLFGFVDRTHIFGMTVAANWQHRVSQRMFIHLQAQFSRQATSTLPNFANTVNVSGLAGITGNNQDPRNYGPPALQFSQGITPLTDGNYANNVNQTMQLNFDSQWIRGRHTVSFGGDVKRLQFNQYSQSNPRGSFGFTGALTSPAGSVLPVGNDFADFLLGVPDTSNLAFGNPDKYFRQSNWDGFVTDDWRVGPALTLQYGMRWTYEAPVTEKYNRLLNLDLYSGYNVGQPVDASHPVGPLTGFQYGSSLIQPDKSQFEPRLSLAWRPIPASSLLVRASYQVGHNTSVYQALAQLMSQQSLSPSSKSVILSNATTPLTLANGFNAPATALPVNYAVDPNFRVGYAQNFQVSIQRDLPGSLVMSATYLGIKGTRGQQEFVPNTYPAGAINPCPSCPTGFYYLDSNGNSIRHSGQLALRRRLHNGLTANMTYTFAKSIDDSALGGRGSFTSVVAQNWLDLSAERGLSTFDQRHNVNFQLQYTTGQGIGGGGLLTGWRATAFHEWTLLSTVIAGTGFPLSPSVLSASLGRTGITGPVRPDYTGQPIYNTTGTGVFLNSSAYALPVPGEWGNAGRDTITGPSQFSLNASLRRSFRLKDRYSLDVNIDANNLLNHVNYTSWITAVNSNQFGVAAGASQMRILSTTLRVRF